MKKAVFGQEIADTCRLCGKKILKSAPFPLTVNFEWDELDLYCSECFEKADENYAEWGRLHFGITAIIEDKQITDTQKVNLLYDLVKNGEPPRIKTMILNKRPH